jgi:hypothetical protein
MTNLLAFALGAMACAVAVWLWPLPLTHVTDAKTAKRMISRRPALAAGYCVYVLFDGSTVVYVGMTKQLPTRLRQHSGKPYTHSRAIKCKRHEQAVLLESHLINVFRNGGEAHLNKQ